MTECTFRDPLRDPPCPVDPKLSRLRTEVMRLRGLLGEALDAVQDARAGREERALAVLRKHGSAP